VLQHHQEEALKEVEEMIFMITDVNNLIKRIDQHTVAIAQEVVEILFNIIDMNNINKRIVKQIVACV
jgi:hypothetical protein